MVDSHHWTTPSRSASQRDQFLSKAIPLALQLYNTLSREKERFEPLDLEHVRVYACGPTVYQRIHIGNARPIIIFDVLFRLLRQLYPKVTYIRNITDIDDRIIAEAAANKEEIAQLTERTAMAFRADCAALGCLEPTVEPRATSYVDDMVRLIETLIAKGHAYAAEGHVLFSVPSYEDYGKLSRRPRDEQIAGARVEVAPYKRDPADFVLWKPSTNEQPGWSSPWGFGRPGWHIECSAMAATLLGVPFDIHAGGLDLIFPHHENEIAQSCCAHDTIDMARYWLHNGFVDMSGEKMSKSVGNVVRVNEVLEMADPDPIRQGEIVRFWMLSAHYRQPIDFNGVGLKRAKTQLDRFYGSLARAGGPEVGAVDDTVLAALGDDLNTPAALTALHELLTALNSAKDEDKPALAAKLRASGGLLGILQADPQTWLKGAWESGDDWIEEAIADRIAARKARDFARADSIRDEMATKGIILEDGPGGTTWRRS